MYKRDIGKFIVEIIFEQHKVLEGGWIVPKLYNGFVNVMDHECYKVKFLGIRYFNRC